MGPRPPLEAATGGGDAVMAEAAVAKDSGGFAIGEGGAGGGAAADKGKAKATDGREPADKERRGPKPLTDVEVGVA